MPLPSCKFFHTAQSTFYASIHYMRHTSSIIRNKPSWLSEPEPGHLVHFYQSENTLLNPLSEYIGSGLHKGEACIVIATASHIQKLNRRLKDEGLDLFALQESGYYITLDADETLARFMMDDLPDKSRFQQVVGALVEKSAQNGKPVRAYGEMVALLWQEANKEGVLQLEELWNELAITESFSLFCAYPELHFIMHHHVIEEIREYHNVDFSPQNIVLA